MAGINFPLGIMDVPAQPVTTGAAAYTITNALTYIALAGLTGTVTINLTFDGKLLIGSRIFIKVLQGGTAQNVVLGTNFASGLLAAIQTLTGVISNENTIECVYDGTSFRPTGAWQRTV